MLQELLHFHGTWRTYQQRVLDRFDKYSDDKKLHVVAAHTSLPKMRSQTHKNKYCSKTRTKMKISTC